ncbi:MAG TPA: HAMP domain-containing sensor histidine kinase [Fimbriimonadaceae bacterium]
MKELVVTDHRKARQLFLQALDDENVETTSFLEELSGPGDGRLRQMVSSSLLNHSAAAMVSEKVQAWLVSETDEFARRAEVAFLRSLDPRGLEKPGKKIGHHGLVETYRYLQSRMSHDIRNGLYGPRAKAAKLRRLADNLEGDQRKVLLDLVGGLEEELAIVGRIVEMEAGDEEYFQFKDIELCSWLKQLDTSYARKYRPIGFVCLGNGSVKASDYLLHRIFWNIWINAHRVVGQHCIITIVMSTPRNGVNLRVSDNGEGFDPRDKDFMFKDNIASQRSRGLGLLEMHEAVERLGGTIVPYEDENARLRIEIRLPSVK